MQEDSAQKISRSKNFRQRGASLVEYGLIIALIALIALPAVQQTGKRLKCSNYTSGSLLTARLVEEEISGLTTYVKMGYCSEIGITGDIDTAKNYIYNTCMSGASWGGIDLYAACFP